MQHLIYLLRLIDRCITTNAKLICLLDILNRYSSQRATSTTIRHRMPHAATWYLRKALLLPALCAGFMCAEAQAQGPTPGPAPTGDTVNSITPLQIGDTIPEYLWHLPLQVVNHPEGKDTITLNDYRGKIILLDFLSTGCSGCIQALPELETAQAAFAEEVVILPITTEKEDRITSFLPKNQYIKDIRFPFVVQDKMLKKHFPHRYISHVVWIDGMGLIRASTNANHVTMRTIRQLQNGEVLDWPVKAEYTSFFNAPLATLHPQANELPNNTIRPFYYSMITGYTEGVGPYVNEILDSAAQVKWVSYRNRSILELYFIALNRAQHVKPHQIVWEVATPAKYDFAQVQLKGTTRDEWYQKNAISYECTQPIATDNETFCRRLQYDLDRYLNLNGRIEMRDTFCLVLQHDNHTPIPTFKGNSLPRLNSLQSDSETKRLSGFPLSYLVELLNEKLGRLVLDGTNDTRPVDILLAVDDLANISDLRIALKPYGLDLVEQLYTEEFFVLTEL